MPEPPLRARVDAGERVSSTPMLVLGGCTTEMEAGLSVHFVGSGFRAAGGGVSGGGG